MFEVPLHLDPLNAADWNYRDQEAIIVTNKYNPAYRRDIVFVGDPTPDMDPMDDEAQEITDRLRNSGVWQHPIDSLNMNYSQSVLSDFERQLAGLLASAQSQVKSPPPNMSLGSVSQADFEKLQQQVATLMERNAQLESAMVKEKAVGRRV